MMLKRRDFIFRYVKVVILLPIYNINNVLIRKKIKIILDPQIELFLLSQQGLLDKIEHEIQIKKFIKVEGWILTRSEVDWLSIQDD